MKIVKLNLFLVILGISKFIRPFKNAILTSFMNQIEVKNKKKTNGKIVKLL